MACVAFDPAPVDLVTAGGFVEATPEVLVFHRSLGHRAPAARLPQRQPLADAVAHILAVGVQLHTTGAFQRIERLDGGGELHAVVGGRRFAAPNLPLVVAEYED